MLDSHCHLNDPMFNGEVDQIVNNFLSAGVDKAICIGCCVESSRDCIELANKYDCIYCTIGVHPSDCEKYNEQALIDMLEEKNNKIVAIGEIGLDYYYGKDNKEKQIEVFKKQIKLANEYKLPIVIHCRDAYGDTLNILKAYKPQYGAVMHCYSGSLEFANEIIKLGYYISFTGSVTFNNARNLHNVAKNIPIDKFFFETDSPYLTPVPNRGKRNEPKNVLDVARFVADLRGIDANELIKITDNTAKKFFNI